MIKEELIVKDYMIFLQENITSKYKNKLIIMDNASSHRNQNIKDLRDIPLTTFNNIFKGVYESPKQYKLKNKTRKIKKTIYIVGVLHPWTFKTPVLMEN